MASSSAFDTAVADSGLYAPSLFGAEVLTAYSGRTFPNERRDDFLRSLDLDPSRLVLLSQVHSANIVRVTSGQTPSPECKADGMLSQEMGPVLGVFTADCVPVFLYDPVKRVVGIAHAGWRGIYNGVVKKLIQATCQNCLSRPESIQLAIGPGIRKCCYEVGAEFQDFFGKHYIPKKNSGDHPASGVVDLSAAIRDQAAQAGVPAGNIVDTEICNACRNDAFFSARRENATPERILSIIKLRTTTQP